MSEAVKHTPGPKLTLTRPEKDHACSQTCFAMRAAMVEHVVANDLNHAEALNAAAQVFSSILAGAYAAPRDREIVISGLPDIVRAYLPQWDKIYADFLGTEQGRAR